MRGGGGSSVVSQIWFISSVGGLHEDAAGGKRFRPASLNPSKEMRDYKKIFRGEGSDFSEHSSTRIF